MGKEFDITKGEWCDMYNGESIRCATGWEDLKAIVVHLIKVEIGT